MQTFRIANLNVVTVHETADRICYILYPFEALGQWVEEAAYKYDVSIVAISGMEWDDDLTPWPAPGQPPGSPDFKGKAPEFFDTLINDVVPEVERQLKIAKDAERTLTGVSLSGLFTLWQWLLDDTFHNIISLSGSFWYSGFAPWVESQSVPANKGRAYFLLGNQEARTRVRAFQPVQRDTVAIVDYLKAQGIDCIFELVPGNHYEYGEQRLNRAFAWMFGLHHSH